MESTNKKILLVEDDLNFGAVLKDYLMLNDFEVVLAKNGMEGFEKFKKDTYDLCILDVMMPYKDGYTLAKEIREKNNEVPIIFLTAKSMKEDVLKGYKAGADDYLNKPFDSEVLLMKIKAIKKLRFLGVSIYSATGGTGLFLTTKRKPSPCMFKISTSSSIFKYLRSLAM